MALVREGQNAGHELHIVDDYRVMVEEVLPSLGWPNALGSTVPSFGQVEASIDAVAPLAGWLIERAEEGIEDRLVIAPALGGSKGVGFYGAVQRLCPRIYSGDFAAEELWSRVYSHANPDECAVIHDNAGPEGLSGLWDVAVLLEDTVDPSTGEKAHSKGLVYTNKTVAEQQEAFAVEAEATRAKGIELVSATVGHVIVDSAFLRESGEHQRRGITRFIHYPPVDFANSKYFRGAAYTYWRLYFSGGETEVATDDSGVRRAVRIPVLPR